MPKSIKPVYRMTLAELEQSLAYWRTIAPTPNESYVGSPQYMVDHILREIASR